MILSALLLQKPSHNSKAKNHCKKLEERYASWKRGEVTQLLKEGEIIQDRLKSSRQRSPQDQARIFSNLMLQGKVSAAIKLLSSDPSIGVHEITDDVIKALKEKHPAPAPIADNTLLNRTAQLTKFFLVISMLSTKK